MGVLTKTFNAQSIIPDIANAPASLEVQAAEAKNTLESAFNNDAPAPAAAPDFTQ